MKSEKNKWELQSGMDELSRWEPLHGRGEMRTSLVEEYYRSLARHSRLIIVMALGFALLGFLAHLATQPTYRTRTSLDIQSVNSDFMNLHTVDATAATPSDTLVQTQIKLLESDSLRDRVELRMSEEPHPDFILRNDLLSRALRFAHLGGTKPIPYDELLAETAAGVKIKPLGITQLVEISCDSWDPKFAANFCNTLTEQFRVVDLESRGDQAKRISDWLVRQAADVRQKAEESQQRLISATGGDGLILSQHASGVGEDALRSMQAEVVRAQAARMEAEAQLSVRKDIANEGPVSNESAAYAADKVRLTDLQTQLAALVPGLTEANPKVIHLRSQIRQVQANLDKEVLESDEKLKTQYDSAKHREVLLTATYNALEGKVSSSLQKSSGVDLLRREVESEQQLYQTLLQKAKEAGFASAMPASTIRVVDAAKTPKLSALPQRLSTILAAFFFGGFGGVAVALFKDRTSNLLRLPGDSEHLLHTHELGVIPSPLAIGSTINARRAARGGSSRALLALDSQETLHAARWEDDLSLVAEAYRNASISILNADHKTNLKSYLISSPSAGEGKTTITCNIGIALSKAKLRVLLIDGDLRKPSLHKAFSVSNKVGLRQILEGDGLPASDLYQKTSFDHLSVVTAGAGTSTTVELLHTGRFSELMADVVKEFDVVLVDTPPMLHMADARLMARDVEGTILVFRSGVTSREDALTARTMLARDQVHVVGTILNDFNPRDAGKYGYYASYSAYQRDAVEEHAGVSS